MMDFSKTFLNETKQIIDQLDFRSIEQMAQVISEVRENDGRLFIIGSGGGAGHASHSVCDFRKLCNIEAYAPYDNISELTARVNDEGWDTTIVNWLMISHFKSNDALLVFSVGGGNKEKNISANLVYAIDYAKEQCGKVTGIVGRDGGHTKKVGDAVVVIPTVSNDKITPHTEGFQAIVWHLLVSHPLLQTNPTKWESTK
jgi:D-sedoheptulose 7-phosphate isomerase